MQVPTRLSRLAFRIACVAGVFGVYVLSEAPLRYRLLQVRDADERVVLLYPLRSRMESAPGGWALEKWAAVWGMDRRSNFLRQLMQTDLSQLPVSGSRYICTPLCMTPFPPAEQFPTRRWESIHRVERLEQLHEHPFIRNAFPPHRPQSR